MEEVDVARLRHVRPRHYGRVTAVVITLLLVGLLVDAFARGKIDWSTTREFLFWPTILWGLFNTIWLSIACMVIGIVIGVLCAVARGSPNPGAEDRRPVLRLVLPRHAGHFAAADLVQSRAGLSPYRHTGICSTSARSMSSRRLVATLLGLGLNEGAYVSEIVRAGLLSVDRGQYEASKSIGMSYWLSLRRIILPQAMRVVVPPLGNEFIALLKITSLASIIGFSDILRNAQDIYYTNAKVIELLMVAAFWYLIVVSVLSVFQAMLENRFGRGFTSSATR